MGGIDGMNKTPLAFPDFREPVERDGESAHGKGFQYTKEQIRNLVANREMEAESA